MTFPIRTLAPITAALALGLATPVEAADIFVPTDFATIQEAVDSASTGDRIIISRKQDGAYNEYVTISTDNLTILGKNIVIDVLGKTASELADFNDPGELPSLGGLVIDADGVSVSGVSVVNSLSDGIWAQGDGTILSRCETFHNAGNGINVVGDFVELERNESYANGGHGIVYGGSTVSGGGAEIERNITYQNGDSGLFLAGGNMRVSRNRSSNNQDDGILVNSAGFESENGSSQISKNSMTCNGRSGLCVADPGGNPLEVDGNASEANGAYGIAVESGEDIDITKNKVEDNTLSGLWISNAFAVFASQNRIQKNGRSGIEVVNVAEGGNPTGDQGLHVIADNNIQRNGRDGIRLQGSLNELDGNKISRNLGDGIDLESGGGSPTDGNSLTDNRCTRNGGEGIDNDGTLTNMVNNRCQKNGDGGEGPEIAGAGRGDGTLGTFTNNKTTDNTEDQAVAEVTEQVVDID